MIRKLTEKKKLWDNRIEKKTDKAVDEFTESISFDYRLYKYDIKGSKAHVEMLGKCKLINKEEKDALLKALKQVEKEISSQIKNGTFRIDKSYEDIHTYIENKVTGEVGINIGSKLHTARSRNDQVATDTRLYVKDDIIQVLKLLKKLTDTIIDKADEYKYCIMPAYTHMQIAKPVYFRDYIRAYYEMFKRDMERLRDCYKRVNLCPLGSGAVAGTYYPKVNTLMMRNFVAKKLGFERCIENTVDAVSDRDYIAEYLYCLSSIMLHISRLSEDLIIWLSPQFQFVSIDTSFTTGSSILPQKRNPDVCELARAKTGKVYGNLISFLTVMKGLPLSYNRDMQEDKEALFNSSDTTKSVLNIYIKLLKTLKANRIQMFNVLKTVGFAWAPILVDNLAKEGFGFRKAHEFVSRLVSFCMKKNLSIETLIKKGLIKDFLKREEKIDKSSIEYIKRIFL